ncbi:hypothetical protein E5Q_02342 [Mixia osmundae IAM 14324]|uniref:Uncharacterized protein n=2 Tax=Mixia osmundae (strain CBS 9802 / IAM 14324 / JCM 22182 / KY 12970) TaxID=764103 RepID=G7DYM5_MIXOS|nr:hypothetical protein E5Q_02342 [Mixia osmundae IAM 14324]
MSISAAPELSLSAEEKEAYPYFFRQADIEQMGVLTGETAVKFFAKSHLPGATLGTIWSVADSGNVGFLTPEAFNVALRLIAHAQSGSSPAINEATARKATSLPTFQGLTPPKARTSSVQATTPSLTIAPEDKGRFLRMFAGAGAVNGLLDGEKAKDIFIRSQLPVEKLGEIWTLADRQARGSLDATDFIVGMALIQAAMSGKLQTIPSTLPASFYAQASAGAVPANPPTPQRQSSSMLPNINRQSTGSIGSAAPIIPRQITGNQQAAIPRQLTGQASPARQFSQTNIMPRQTISPSTTGTGSNNMYSLFQSQQKQQQSLAWDITPEDKSIADGFFDELDPSRQGFIEGQVAVPFFLRSGLSEAILAQIWDLSDVRSEGRLDREEFAIAMRLITDTTNDKVVPTTLPASLVPPSMRAQQAPSGLPNAFVQAPTGPQRDLLDMDDNDDDPITSQALTSSPVPVKRGLSSPTPAAGTPFAPTSAFGKTMTAPNSAPSPGTSATAPARPSTSATPSFMAPPALKPQGTGNSLKKSVGFSDNFASAPSPIASAAEDSEEEEEDPAETQRQLTEAEKTEESLRTKRTNYAKTVGSNDEMVSSLKTKLVETKAAHETHQKTIVELQARQKQQSIELAGLKEQTISAESELSALRLERDEIEQTLMRGKEEVRQLQARLESVTTETNGLKASIEQAKKDARQHKGLLAISRKQLATAELEQDKAAGSLAEAQKDVEASAAALPAHASPIDSRGLSPDVASPSSVKSRNPFDSFAPPVNAEPSAQRSSGHLSPVTAAAGGAAATGLATGVAALAVSEHGQSSEHAAAGQSQSPFDTGFDDAFGEDLPAASTNSNAAAPPTSFDDAFAAFDEPSAPNGASDRALEPDSPATITETAAAAPIASPDEQFSEAAPTHSPTDALSPTSQQTTIPGGFGSDPLEVGSDSEEEDEGPEDVQPSRFAHARNESDTSAYDEALSSPRHDLSVGSALGDVPAFTAAPAFSATPKAVTPATTGQSAGFGPSGEFEDAFSDLEAPRAAQDTTFGSADDSHAFDADFDKAFDPSFAEPQTNGNKSVAFDDAFAGFDSPAPSVPSSTAAAPGSSFDDFFGSQNQPQGSSSSPAPPFSVATLAPPISSPPSNSRSQRGPAPKLPERTTSPTQSSTKDSAAVKELTAMGFSRTAAIQALAKYDNDLARATNYLIDT